MDEHKLHSEFQTFLLLPHWLFALGSLATFFFSLGSTEETRTIVAGLLSLLFMGISVLIFVGVKRIYYTPSEISIKNFILNKGNEISFNDVISRPTIVPFIRFNIAFSLYTLTYKDENGRRRTAFFIPSSYEHERAKFNQYLR